VVPEPDEGLSPVLSLSKGRLKEHLERDRVICVIEKKFEVTL
jgi:hypothetical protein